MGANYGFIVCPWLMTVCIMSNNPTNIDMLERLFNSLAIRVYAFV